MWIEEIKIVSRVFRDKSFGDLTDHRCELKAVARKAAGHKHVLIRRFELAQNKMLVRRHRVHAGLSPLKFAERRNQSLSGTGDLLNLSLIDRTVHLIRITIRENIVKGEFESLPNLRKSVD